MDNPLTASLWTAVVLYAALGLLGILVLYNTGPNIVDLTAGYGIAYSKVAAAAR